jgi:hypothetical protein
MVATVLSLEEARARRCLRSNGTLPARRAGPRRPDARLARALSAVAAMGEKATFERKLEVFKRVWENGRKRGPKHAEDPR